MPIQGVPFNYSTNTVPHEFGCIVKDGKHIPGLYVAGWLKRGPKGIIDSTLRDAMETVRMI